MKRKKLRILFYCDVPGCKKSRGFSSQADADSHKHACHPDVAPPILSPSSLPTPPLEKELAAEKDDQMDTEVSVTLKECFPHGVCECSAPLEYSKNPEEPSKKVCHFFLLTNIPSH